MQRGWEVEYKDGTVINEDQMSWNKLPNRNDIIRLSLKWDGKQWHLRNKEAYAQKKRGMAIPGRAEAFIIARYIGYYEGAKKVFYKVDEATGQMTLETIEG
jgi:Cft2 family RNA processing exonuclease